MTREEFIKVLDKRRYPYEIKGDKIVVTHKSRFPGDTGHLDFQASVGRKALTSLPPGVVFKNRGDVYLRDLTSMAPGVEFENKGNVYLRDLASLPPGVVFKNEMSVNLNSLTSLPLGVEFKNGGEVWLGSLTFISPGVEFKNGGDVFLKSLTGGMFDNWNGNIEGIDNKRLLNLMISKGLFER